MIEASPNINSLWATLLVEELVRSSVDTFCVAPGSRSSPLAVAAARHRRATSVVHYDERGAAFHALGYGRATRRPAALITTSGTALANVWPAVVEASLDRVPLLVLSGDRPPELQDTAANQTMDQVKFFNGYVRWSAALPCPDTDIGPAVLLTTVDQAVHRAGGSAQGPVHVNCMFREPLAPTGPAQDFGAYLSVLGEWLEQERPYTAYHRAAAPSDEAGVRELAQVANGHDRGLLVAGRLAQGTDLRLLSRLAARLEWPLLPDIASGLRLGGGGSAAVPHYDALLGSPTFAKEHVPDAVLHMGGPVTSRRLLDYLERERPRHYAVVGDHPGRQDPVHTTTLRLDMPVDGLGRRLLPLLSRRPGSAWLSSWRASSASVQRRMRSLLARSRELTEPVVAWLVSRHIDPGEGLFLAASMPVRDMDVFADFGRRSIPVEANRGASGIDGTLACAAGFARGLKRGVTVVIGDLAFLHDLNSLALLRGMDLPVVIVVLNNDGGGIFSFLPIAEHGDVFESHFGTPHGLHFEAAASLFGLNYASPDSARGFVECYGRARGTPGGTLIEVRTDRAANVGVHRFLHGSVLEGIENQTPA